MIVTILRRRLILAPIKLSSVIKHFDGIEHVFAFYDLVHEYLPEEQDRLLPMDHGAAANEFVKLFSKRYFPILSNPYYYGASSLNSVTRSIAIEWHGLREWDYDSATKMSPGRLLASTICVCPVQEGSRIPVVERFQKLVGELELPVKGYSLGSVDQALEGSPWPGLLFWCQWLFSQTGNVWLDTAGNGSPDWARETVDELTADWAPYQEMKKQMEEFDKWLKVDVPARSAEVIEYIQQRRSKPLSEVFEEKESI